MNRSVEVFLYGRQFRRLVEKEFDALQKKYHICKIDLQILLYLYTAGEHNTSKDIVDLGYYTKGHVSQSLSRMQKLHLISMVQDENDRRCMHIMLEKNADEIAMQIKEINQRIQDIVFKGITEEERSSLLNIAQKINHNISCVMTSFEE